MAKAPTKIRSLAREHTERAIQVLAGIMDQPDSAPAARVAAAQAILDRGWGKPSQPLVGGDEDDAPISVQAIIRKIVDPNYPDSDSAGV